MMTANLRKLAPDVPVRLLGTVAAILANHPSADERLLVADMLREVGHMLTGQGHRLGLQFVALGGFVADPVTVRR